MTHFNCGKIMAYNRLKEQRWWVEVNVFSLLVYHMQLHHSITQRGGYISLNHLFKKPQCKVSQKFCDKKLFPHQSIGFSTLVFCPYDSVGVLTTSILHSFPGRKKVHDWKKNKQIVAIGCDTVMVL